MTTPDERTRAMLWAGGFLMEIARDRKLPLEVRRAAVVIARHFPTVEDIKSMALLLAAPFADTTLADPKEILAEIDVGKHGPLLWSTRMGWPE